MNNMDKANCLAGILVGGGSNRMGRCKALIELPGGETMIERVHEAAAAVASEVVILGEGVQLPEKLSALAVLADAVPAGGPLAGLCSLLEHAGNRWALMLACDMPKLGAVTLRKLIDRADDGVDDRVDAIAFARPDQPDSCHACCALYHPRILPAALDELRTRDTVRQGRAGRASLQALLRRIDTTILQPTPADDTQLANVNSPDDLRQLGLID